MRRYAPIRTPARKLMGTPTPIGGTPLYHVPEEEHGQKFDVPTQLEGLPELKPEDHQYFGKLLKEVRPSPLPSSPAHPPLPVSSFTFSSEKICTIGVPDDYI